MNNTWTTWPDVLGHGNLSSHEKSKQEKEELLNLLIEYRESFQHSKTAELIAFLDGKGLYDKLNKYKSFKRIIFSQSNSDERIENIQLAENELKQKLNIEIELEKTNTNADLIDEATEQDILSIIGDNKIGLPEHDIVKSFKLFDDSISLITDQEKIQYLINNRVNEFHNLVMNDPKFLSKLDESNGGKGFTLVKKKFLKEYNDTQKLVIPKGWSFIDPKTNKLGSPNYMQKLIAYKVKQNKSFGNWSSTGAGKSLSATLTSRYLNLKNTMVIADNPILDQWSNTTIAAFPDSVTYKKFRPDDNSDRHQVLKLDNKKFNYIFVNYEFFQQPSSENKIQKFLDDNRIDFVVLDESHRVKQRDKNESIRRSLLKRTLNNIYKNNPNRYLLMMTATPLINNLTEVKATMELLTNKSYDDIPVNSRSIKSCIDWHTLLVNNGIVMNVTPLNKRGEEIEIEHIDIQINGDDLLHQLTSYTNDLEIEQILLYHKLNAIKPYLKTGVFIYSYYVTGIIDKAKLWLENLGYTVGIFTGDNKDGLELFKNGEVDILIGSSPVGTGIDGLQEISDSIVRLSLPWTSAEETQINGRLVRQNSKFDKINIITPIVTVNYPDGEVNKSWSRDQHKLHLINYKRDLFGIVMTGNIPIHVIGDIETLKKKSKAALNELIERFRNDQASKERPEQTLEFLRQQEYNTFKRKLGDFSELNKNWSSKNSKKLHDDLKTNRKHWEYYHQLYQEKRSQWNEIPAYKIAEKLKSRTDYIIADMGCGELLLSNELPNHKKIHSFDHVALDDRAVSCDISKTPLKNKSVDAVVFSLSLMGRNWKDYLKEGHRILKTDGVIHIAEPIEKWRNKESLFKKILREIGFKIYEPEKSDRFIYINGQKM